LKLNKKIRQIHYWISPFIIVPVILIFTTGVLLQLKKQSNWIQPSIEKVSANKPIMLISYLDAAKSIPQAEINSWDDIDRIDIRPDKGIAKIRSNNHWEIQIDSQTAEVFSVNYRRSDIIESVHDGSFFTDYVKFGWFLPTGILLIVVSISGIYMFLLPFVLRDKRAKLRK
jgi:hypothetical protein